MKAKHFLRSVCIVLMIAFTLPASAALVANPSTEPVTVPVTATAPVNADEARMQQLLTRLETIKAMDRSSMSREERKALKKEVKEIRKEIKGKKPIGGGVYLSVGAILVIILLLILLL